MSSIRLFSPLDDHKPNDKTAEENEHFPKKQTQTKKKKKTKQKRK